MEEEVGKCNPNPACKARPVCWFLAKPLNLSVEMCILMGGDPTAPPQDLSSKGSARSGTGSYWAGSSKLSGLGVPNMSSSEEAKLLTGGTKGSY